MRRLELQWQEEMLGVRAKVFLGGQGRELGKMMHAHTKVILCSAGMRAIK